VRSGPVVLLGWGLLLLVHTALQFAFGTDQTQVALLGGAGTACVVAALAWWRAARWPPPDTPRVLPDLSVPTVMVAIGLAAALVGAELGPTLVAAGGGLAVLGLAGIVRERRAEGPRP
jgi:hypothetical protein